MTLGAGLAFAGSLLTLLTTVVLLFKSLSEVGRLFGELTTLQAAGGKAIEKLEAGARDQGRRIEELAREISKLEGSFEYSHGNKA